MSIFGTDRTKHPEPLTNPLATAAIGPSGTELQLDCLIIGGEDTAEAAPSAIQPFKQIVGNPADPAVEAEIDRLLQSATRDFQAGRLKEMRLELQKILALRADHPVAHYNIGVLERDTNQHLSAEGHFRAAIAQDPKNPLYHQALGDLLLTMRHLLFAAAAYEQGLTIAPNHAAMLSNLIVVRQRQRLPEQVVTLSRRSLALDPHSVAAMLSLAWGLLWLGEIEEAAEVVSRALSLEPTSVPAAVTLQIALKRLDRADAAAAAMKDIGLRALDSWDHCVQATDTFFQFEEGEAMESILRSVINKQPDFVPALLQLGRYKILTNEIEEGESLMARVAELDPEEGDAQTSVALTKVRNGHYAEGWSQHHWRWKRSGCEPRWDPPVADWDGKSLDKGGVIFWREQGIGDMIMYAAPAIACRGLAQPIVLETNIRLRSLLQRSFPDMIVCSREDLPGTFLADRNIVAHCPIGDLPHLLQLDMANYPGRDGFLVANPADVKRLRERYQLLFPGKKLIGISWRSGNSSSAIMRSIELPHWMPIFETPDCAFISLQYGDVAKDIASLRQMHGVDIYADSDVDPMEDMDIFAAQIVAMDLVISVDNSTIHVAGALGKMTWALIPAASDWRWLKPEQTSSIWYASLELFRRLPDGDWSTEMERIAGRLRDITPDELTAKRRQLYLRSAEQSLRYGDLNTAELYFRQTLHQEPAHHPSLAGLGQIAAATNHVEDAIGLLRKAVEAEPANGDYWRDYAQALHAGGRATSAALVLREALVRDESDQAALKLGIDIHRTLGAVDEVRNFCARLLRLDPEHREARLELALLQVEGGDFDGAEANFTKVLAVRPEDAVASYSLGCLALRRGDYPAGWRGYARRSEINIAPPQLDIGLADLTETLLTGGALKGHRIAIRAEATLRDQIMFARWLKAVRTDVDFVAAEVDPRLIPLLSGTASGIALFPTGSLSDDDARDLDLTGQVVLADLSARYGCDASALGAGVPYLQFDLGKAAALREDYRAALSCDRLIGLAWRGSDLAVPLEKWLPILRTEGFGFVSLQPGPAQQELHEVFDSLDMQAVRDPSIDAQSNLRGYAAQLAAMDLVIAIDDVPAHLAGALGVNVACLLPQVADWRWLGDDCRETPWYPSMRLYRQASDGNWDTTMTAIARQIGELIEGGKGGI